MHKVEAGGRKKHKTASLPLLLSLTPIIHKEENGSQFQSSCTFGGGRKSLNGEQSSTFFFHTKAINYLLI